MFYISKRRKIDSRLLNRIKSNKDEKVPIIILTKSLEKLKRKKVLQECQCEVKYRLDLIDAVAVEIPASKINKLSEEPNVKFIADDSKVTTQMEVVRGSVSSDISEEMGLDGEGIGVAILDTGVFPHEDLVARNNRVVAFKDFVGSYDRPYDDNGHGTHVAGIIAGDGYSSSGKYRGIAPKANIIAAKVMNSGGGGSTSDIVAGMQWVLDNRQKYNIKIVSMSLGSDPDLNENDDPLVKGVNALWSKGIVVVTAAGNAGPETSTINSPGISSKVITVGCSDSKGTPDISDDSVAEFSSRGPTPSNKSKPDLVAPGVDVNSLGSEIGYRPKGSSKTRGRSYAKQSGTSMSTPVVSGAIALLLQKQPNLSPQKVKRKLLQSTNKIQGNSRYEQGRGIIDIKSLLS